MMNIPASKWLQVRKLGLLWGPKDIIRKKRRSCRFGLMLKEPGSKTNNHLKCKGVFWRAVGSFSLKKENKYMTHSSTSQTLLCIWNPPRNLKWNCNSGALGGLEVVHFYQVPSDDKAREPHFERRKTQNFFLIMIPGQTSDVSLNTERWETALTSLNHPLT